MSIHDLIAFMRSTDPGAWIDVRIVALMYDTTVEHIIRELCAGGLRFERDEWGCMFIYAPQWVARHGDGVYHRRS